MSNYFNRYKGLFEYEKHTSVAERSSLTAFFQNAGADTTMASQAVQHHLSGVIGGDGGGVGGATATGGMNAGAGGAVPNRSLPESPRIRMQRQQQQRHERQMASVGDGSMFHHKILFSPMQSMSLPRPAPPSDYGLLSSTSSSSSQEPYPEQDLLARAISAAARRPNDAINSPRQRLAVLSESIKKVNDRHKHGSGSLASGNDTQGTKVQMQTYRAEPEKEHPENLRPEGHKPTPQDKLVSQMQEQQQQQQQQQSPRGHVTFAKQNEILLGTGTVPTSSVPAPGILPETASREVPHRPHRRPLSTISLLNSPRRVRVADAAAGSSSEELAGIPQSYDLVPFSGNDVETNVKHPLGVSSPRHPAGILPGDDARKIAGLRSPRRGTGSMAPATESESDLRHMMWVDQALPGGRGSGAGGTFNDDFVPKQRLVFTANTEEERQAMVRRINRWLQSSNELRRKFGKNGGMPVNLTFSGMVDDLPPAVLRRHKATTEGLARRRRELAKLLKADQESYEERRKKNARMRLGRLPFKLL